MACAVVYQRASVTVGMRYLGDGFCGKISALPAGALLHSRGEDRGFPSHSPRAVCVIGDLGSFTASAFPPMTVLIHVQ